MTTQGTCCSEQVAMRLDGLGLREGLTQNVSHHRLEFRTNTTAIKEDRRDLRGIELGKEFGTEDQEDGIARLMDRIQTLGVKSEE